MTKIHIRPGTAADLHAVHQLVGELAEYENAAHAFTATLEDYQQDFASGIFETIVAEDAGEIIGMTLYYISYSTWKGRMLFLEDFVVAAAHRRRGVGQLLFDAYVARARELDCRIVKWQVLDWNEPAINFYEENGAIIERDWWNGKIFL
jgi:GNAT superfamily N-acetyltransferase